MWTDTFPVYRSPNGCTNLRANNSSIVIVITVGVIIGAVQIYVPAMRNRLWCLPIWFERSVLGVIVRPIVIIHIDTPCHGSKVPHEYLIPGAPSSPSQHHQSGLLEDPSTSISGASTIETRFMAL